MEEKSLFCPNQYWVHPFDPCKNQLLTIVDDIYVNFDKHPTLEMRANYLVSFWNI